MPQTASVVLRYFKLKDDNRRYCNKCTDSENKGYKRTTGTSSLKRHLAEKHGIVIDNKKSSSSSPSSSSSSSLSGSSLSSSSSSSSLRSLSLSHPSTSPSIIVLDADEPIKKSKHVQHSLPQHNSKQSKPKQQSLKDSLLRSNNVGLLSMITTAFAISSLPLQLLESESFLNLLYYVRQTIGPMPTRHAVRDHQHTLVADMTSAILTKLRGPSSHVSLSLDSWTNVRHDKVVNIVPMCNGVAYYWDSIVNSMNNNTASWQFPRVKESFLSIISKGVSVVAMVADNEAVNGALYRLMKDEFPFLVRVPCAAHTIQLCVKKIIDLPEVRTVVVTMNEIINAFAVSKNQRLQLKNMQATVDAGNIKLMVRPCDTRWSSTLRAAERVLLLKRYIDIIIPQSSSFWDHLQMLIKFLLQYQISTDILQADISSLYDVYLQFVALQKHAASIAANDFIYPLKESVASILTDNWTNHVNQSAVISCAVLALDDHYKSIFNVDDIDNAKGWFFDFGTNYLRYYSLSVAVDSASIKNILVNQYLSFLGRTGIFKDILQIKQEIQDGNDNSHGSSSIDSGSKKYRHWDAKLLWSYYADTAPELSCCAIAMLSISASEAAVERTFSVQKLVHSYSRNRLLDRSVKNEMFIRFNSRALSQDRVNLTHGSWVEIDDDYNYESLMEAFIPLSNSDVTESGNSAESSGGQEVDDASEEKYQQPLSPLDQFIADYIKSHPKLGRRSKWTADRENELQGLAIERGIRHTVADLQRMISEVVDPNANAA